MGKVNLVEEVALAAKARNNGWVGNGALGKKGALEVPKDLFGRAQKLAPPPSRRAEDMQQDTGFLGRTTDLLRRQLDRVVPRLRSLGRATTHVVVHHPHHPILLTKQRREEKPKTKVERWMMGMVLPLAFELWAFPYRLGFGSPGGHDSFILGADISCDCVFLLDFLFSFFIRIPANTYPNQREAFNSIRTIIPQRIKRDSPELISPAIIYYVATVALDDIGNTSRWLWWASTLPRMATRLHRLLRYFRRMETNLDVSVRTLQAVKFGLIIFLSCHWVGCIFFFLSRLNSFDNTTWVRGFENMLPLYDSQNSSASMHYLLCLYKGFNGLSNLGYDQGLPQNAVEMVWALVVMALQVYLSALILGTLLNFLVTKDPVAEAYRKKVDDMGVFMENKQIPADLRERIFKHMHFQYEKNVLTKEAASLHLPHSLRVKVADAKYRGIINKCTLRSKPFFACNPQFINTVMTKLTVMHVMAGEELAKKGDIPRELYFVLDGTLHVIDEDNRVKSVIRNDVPDMAPIAGEVPFFLGINHMSNIRARPDGSVQLLKLSKEDSIEIFQTYPEEFDIICGNLLAKYDLDLKGQQLGEEVQGELDADTQELKRCVMESMKSRRERRFVTLLQSVANGDVEAVQLAVRQGAEIDQRNYDGRSILHMAAADGNYKMVEMLLEQGADKDCRDRWGRTPLAEAILNRHSLVAGLLAQWKGSLAMENPAGALCEFAGSGDVEQVRRLVENKIDADEADYDGRCALHISSAEGHDKVVEYLLSKKANPNATDRWGGTPLLDAVRNGHVVCASLLRAKGARMPQMVGADEVCGAAGMGDVKKLRLLHDCGEGMDVCDYDSRYPLHLAAAEARILAVSFLLGISTDPNCFDRWGGTPLDDALRGGTLYHLYCAKLIQGWGGELGTLANTEQGEAALRELEKVKIKDVRLVIKALISKGYDKMVPKRTSDEELLVAREASMQILGCTHQLRARMEEVNGKVQELAVQVRADCKMLRDAVSKLTVAVASAELSQKHGKGVRHSHSVSDFSQAATEGARRWEADSPSPLPGNSHSSKLIRHCHDQLAAQDSEDEEAVTDKYDVDEADLDMGLDSDEEAQLHAEIDALLEAQERFNLSGLSAEKQAAKTFQKVALHIVNYESAFETLASFIHCTRAARGEAQNIVARTSSAKGDPTWEPSLAVEDIGSLLQQLHAPSNVEVGEMFEEAALRDGGSSLPYNSLSHRHLRIDLLNDAESTVPLSSLIARSRSFRHAVLGMKTDARVCGVMKTRVRHILRESQVRVLLTGAKDVTLKQGQLALDIAEGIEAERGGVSSKGWVVVLGGELKLSIVTQTPKKGDANAKDTTVEEKLVGAGDYFGVETALKSAKKSTFRATATTTCQLVELPLTNLRQFPDMERDLVKLLRFTGERSELEPAPPTSPPPRKPGNLRETFKRGLTRQGGFFGKSSANVNGISSPRPRMSEEESLQLVDGPVGVGAGMRSEMTEEERMEVHKMIHQITEVWRNLAQGQQTLNMSQIRGISRHLGEVGSELFKELFMSPKRQYAEAISESNFWELWVSFFREEVFGTEKQQQAVRRSSLSQHPETALAIRQEEELEALRMAALDADDDLDEDPDSWFEHLHSRFAPSRRLRPRFFEDDVIEHYEKVYVQIVGDLNNNLELKRIPPFLLHIFVDYPYKVSPYNVREFLDVFLREKASDAKFITWNDIAKVLRERRMGIWIEGEGSYAFVGSMFHPGSVWMRRWQALLRLVAVFHFVVVPVRACFLPWDSMLHPTALVSDLPADIITFLNLLVACNTAYKSSKSVWVTNRFKVLRRLNAYHAVAAVPIDWFAYLCGASNAACCILRFNKMLLLMGSIGKSTVSRNSKSNWHLILRMICMVAIALHLSSCIWFFIGSHYLYWVPAARAVSWLEVSDELAHSTYDRDEHFAMQPHATTWEEYLLSLYWVSSTLAVNGLIGELLPQNPLEVVFTILLMALNMTLVRWVIGEVSTIVMSSDKEIVKAREELEAVDQFLSGNNLPEELQKEIRVHFRTMQGSQSVDQGEVMSGMSYSLKVEVASITSREYLEGVDLFLGCSPRLLESVSVLLNETPFAPEEVLFHAGTAAKEMYFVVSGAVEEVMEGEEGEEVVDAVRRAHHSVGSIPFCFALRHFNTSRASKLGGCVCLRLEREQFFDLLKMYPVDEEIISNNAMSTLDAIKSRAGSSRRGGSKAGGSVASSSKGSVVSSIQGPAAGAHADGEETQEGAAPEGSVAAGGSQRMGSEREKDIETESGKGSGAASDDLEALVGSNMKEKISALKNRRKRERVNMLLTAAMQGDAEKVATLVTANVTVNAVDSNKRTPLHVAASEGHLKLVRTLLEMRADVTLKDAFSNTAFNDAVRHKNDEVVKLLRDFNESVSFSLPGCAAAVMMCEEAHAGNLKQIRRLVENGVSVNDADYDGRTALHLAVCEGQADVVHYLLERKADVNCEDRFGGTPMEDAIRHDRVAVQEILMQHGASLVKAGSSFAGKLCLMSATGDLHGVSTLHRNGFDVTEGDYDKRTALHLASANDKVSVLEFLLALQPPINVNLVDRFGGTPLDDAKRHGSTAAIAMLTKRGCVTSDNPQLPELLREQERVEAERGRQRRASPVRKKVKHSPEGAALALVEERVLPELASQGQVLSRALSELERRVEAALLLASERRVEEHTSSDTRDGIGSIITMHSTLMPPLPGLVVDILERIESDASAEALSHSSSGGVRREESERSSWLGMTESAGVLAVEGAAQWNVANAGTPGTKAALERSGMDMEDHGVPHGGAGEPNAPIIGSDEAAAPPAVEVEGEARLSSEDAVTAIIRSDDSIVTPMGAGESPAGFNGGTTSLGRMKGDSACFSPELMSPKAKESPPPPAKDLPHYASILEAAEAVIEQAKEVRHAAASLRALLAFDLGNNGSAPIDCVTWTVLRKNYEKECTAVYVQIRRAAEVSGVARKLMKSVIKAHKRRKALAGRD